MYNKINFEKFITIVKIVRKNDKEVYVLRQYENTADGNTYSRNIATVWLDNYGNIVKIFPYKDYVYTKGGDN